MPTTTFIALQCCQCSTMQVKQERKGKSNQWRCVVCNQKQSVRKVFAQEPMARDLRHFVQSFNMSRQFASSHQPNTPAESETAPDRLPKKRTDWTEYLDPDDHDQTKHGGSDNEFKIVTELPREMFKKPKFENYCDESNSAEGDGLLKPVFSKRNSHKQAISQEKKTESYLSDAIDTVTSKGNSYIKHLDSTKAKGLSKWNHYITQEDDGDDLRLRDGKNVEEEKGRWSNSSFEFTTNDQKIDDEIHPDFL